MCSLIFDSILRSPQQLVLAVYSDYFTEKCVYETWPVPGAALD